MSTRILVVDDESDTLDLLRTILQLSGYEPITTLNSLDAIELAKAEKPDVALLDIMMPKLDGFELAKQMREDPATRELPVIFVTAYEALDLEERRREAGADLVIHKPIDFDLLINGITDILRLRSLSERPAPDAPVDAQPDTGANAKPDAKPDTKPGSRPGSGPASNNGGG